MTVKGAIFENNQAPPNQSYVSMHAQQFGLDLKSGQSKKPVQQQHRLGQAEFIQSAGEEVIGTIPGRGGVSHSFERR